MVEILADLGLAPVPDNRLSVVQLIGCPLLEPGRIPDVVCDGHLGIVCGAVDEYGSDAERTEPFPFFEPGA